MIVLFGIRLTSGFVSVVVLSPLGSNLILLSAGEDRSCCHFINWLRWVCLRISIEHFLWDGVFNPVWFSHLARLSRWFCVCNSHHTACLHGMGWCCHHPGINRLDKIAKQQVIDYSKAKNLQDKWKANAKVVKQSAISPARKLGPKPASRESRSQTKTQIVKDFNG